MKRKVIAILACILVAGTAGVSANAVTANVPSTVVNTVSSPACAAVNKNTNSTYPTSTAVKALQAAAQNGASCKNTFAAVLANCKNPSGNSANSTPTPNAVKSQNTTVNTQNSASSTCPINLFNYTNGTCLSNVLSNKSNGYLAYFLNCKNGSSKANTTNNSASKPSTSSVPATSSKPTTSTTTSKPSTTVSSTPSATSQSNSSFASFQNQVIQLVNEQRAANGLKPLTANTQLTNTATLKSQDMAKLNYFDHTSPTYGSPFDMMKKYGISYRTAGENIAMGQTTPAQVMQGWMNSPGHRANILNASFTQIGVGIAKNAQGQLIWTQQFIG